MPHNCSCGGRLAPYMDNQVYFTVRCVKCGATHRQKKRKTKPKP